MKWTKSPPQLIATFESVVPGAPVVARPMFGYPAAFVNGNMFMSLFEDRMILRLDERHREQLLAAGGRVFEPMKGRPMSQYIEVPDAIVADKRKLKTWVAHALDHGASLPPKAKKSAKSTKSRSAKRPR